MPLRLPFGQIERIGKGTKHACQCSGLSGRRRKLLAMAMKHAAPNPFAAEYREERLAAG
jgi:hypothetical protein